MTVTPLRPRSIEKPWGRHGLGEPFASPAAGGDPVGEIWFESAGNEEPALLVKYLFTSRRLSVQVHPDDITARAAGFPRGKDEAWMILDAVPGATIALGTRVPLTREELRAASLDGSIERLLDWKPVKAGDFYYSPAGTVHAIGSGITLVEIQQNVDLTYRLYDYGSTRELHLEAGVAVSNPVPYVPLAVPQEASVNRTILAEGPKLVVERLSGHHHLLNLPNGMSCWLVPLAGRGTVDGVPWLPGQCFILRDRVEISASSGGDLLLAYVGDRRVEAGA